jgi:MerR family transcriptional regulator, light-induced transcriptional regulator
MTLYSIKDLEYLSGIKAHTIRIWEKRYHLLDPSRTDTNIRSYSDEDVRRILNVSMLIKNGYKISNVAAYDIEKLQSEVIRLTRNSVDPDRNIDRLLYFAVNLDSYGFEEHLDQIIEELGFQKTILQVVFPFFERIGILWQAGTIFAAHEHFVSNLIRNRFIREISQFKCQESSKSILFFLRENEYHELGLLYSNYLATQAGLRCIYLGQNLPFGDLSNLLNNSQFDFVCTSFISAIEKAELEQYLANLSLVFNKNKILVAGRQLAILKPRIPANVVVFKNSAEFLKRLTA